MDVLTRETERTGRRYLSVREAADVVGLSRGTLQNAAWRERVGLEALRAGNRLRFDPADLDKWLRRQTGGQS